ncbi:MAG: histidinol dehydrogenase [Deltaproteobacteria bacterium]|nr:MAG: histidinol dehydrogenase [Deltaproteobacteria bacterium]
MKQLNTKDSFFPVQWDTLLSRAETQQNVEFTVKDVIADVRQAGDLALKEFCEKFDGHSPETLEVSQKEMSQALRSLKKDELKSLNVAAQRIRQFHQKQFSKITKNWKEKKNGIVLGEMITPIERVGIYVPGGLAGYPSAVLMDAIPARMAGVKEMIMTTPWPQGKPNRYTLAAAKLAGVDHVFKVGGAQAIAALAYGTESIPNVDKITGPGNIYVATAKRLVFGKVGIDMVAGPTEVVIVADDTAQPDFIAADLLSQAEHDPQAVAIVISHSAKLLEKTQQALKAQMEKLDRQNILVSALGNGGYVIQTKNVVESIRLANEFAAEHLELQIKNPEKYLKGLNAGAIFLGNHTPVAVGDYLSGPNHTLPTSGTARFSSPLGVLDFVKRTSIASFDAKALKRLGPDIVKLATMEGLTAHGSSIEVRTKTV